MVLNDRAMGTLGTSGGSTKPRRGGDGTREMDSIGATQANFLPRPFVVPPPSVRRRSGPACLPVRASQGGRTRRRSCRQWRRWRRRTAATDLRWRWRRRERGGGEECTGRSYSAAVKADGLCGGGAAAWGGRGGRRVHSTRASTFQVLVVVLGRKQSDLTRERDRETEVQ